jgi:hypothetical protein
MKVGNKKLTEGGSSVHRTLTEEPKKYFTVVGTNLCARDPLEVNGKEIRKAGGVRK